MAECKGQNRIKLRGWVSGEARLTHQNHGVSYATIPFSVPRLSGAEDVLNLVVAEPDPELWQQGSWLSVAGEVRSYNNRSGQGAKLVITVLVRSAVPAEPGEGENQLILSGVVCRPPTRRRTPLGREICDLLLAVNRTYGRADYLPCIAWGSLAGLCGSLDVGSPLSAEGRLQSRSYRKMTENGAENRVAYEVSIMNLLTDEEGDAQ